MLRAPPLAVLPLAALVLAVPARADEKSWMISGFDRVRVEGPFTVRVITGANAGPKARASGDQRGLDRVSVRVDGRTLVVTRNVNSQRSTRAADVVPPIEVSVPVLRAGYVIGGATLEIDRMAGARVDLAVTGPGVIRVGRVDADRIATTVVGNGSVTVAGRVLDARFQTNGAGTIDAAALSAAALTVIAQGPGEGRYAARNTADITTTGQGSITVSGMPACTVRGTAPVQCGTGGAVR